LLLVIVTVAGIPLLLEWRERKRWLPARQRLYRRLFLNTDALLHHLMPPAVRMRDSAGDTVVYAFGPNYSVSGSKFGCDFGTVLNDLDSSMFEESAEELSALNRDVLSNHQQQLDKILGQSAVIFLSAEPKLNELVSDVDERLAQAISMMDRYRRGSESLQQVGVIFSILAHSAYALRLWLGQQATKADHYQGGT
jgi:hypothetical protein